MNGARRRPATGAAPPPPALVAPVRIVDVEASMPAEPIDARSPSGETYGAAVVLVRIHGRPVAMIEVALPVTGLAADEVAAAIEAGAGKVVAAHLASDAAMARTAADGDGGRDGGRAGGRPPCLVERDRSVAVAPQLAVVIPSRDRPERAAACVASVLATGYPDLDVVVVDNARTSDRTEVEIARRFADAPVRYLREDRAGSARARNRGLESTRAPLIAFIDDDVLVDAGWAAAVVRPFQEDPSVGCVTGMIVAAELETPAQLWIEEYGGFGKGFERRTFDLGRYRVDHPLYPFAAGMYGSGATMAFRREALAGIGGFDEALGGGTPARGGEDLAAFVETILAGWRLVYEPAALVRHHHHREYEQLRRVMYGYGTGLSAFLTSVALRDPRRVPSMLARAVRASIYVLDPSSPKNAKKRADYPRELGWLELRGLAVGPLAYLRSRRAAAPRPRAAAPRPRAVPMPAAEAGAVVERAPLHDAETGG